MKENKKFLQVFAVLALVVAVLGISVGFAALSQTLTINGTAQVTPADWDIHFENLVQPYAITGGASITGSPTLSATHFGNYNVVLTKPGDEVVIQFDVTNDGDIPAKLTDYTFATPTIVGTAVDSDDKAADEALVAENLVYTLTYSGGTAIVKNTDTLAKDETKTLVLTVGYKSTATEMPSAAVNITGMDVTFVYTQN